jgi:hypothetical protein
MTELEQYNAAALQVRNSPKLRAKAWRKGRLWWLLRSHQYPLHERFWASTDDQVWDCARRIGKTFLLLTIACEVAIRTPNASIKYAASTAKAVRKMVRPSLRKVLETCPKDMRPKIDWVSGEITFPNGSTIDVAGCDSGNYDALRGQEAHLWIVDEAGFIADLSEVVDSVLDPQTWTTKGRGIISSSPPDTPAHPFQTYYLAAKATGNSARVTFWENTGLTETEKNEIIAKAARRKRMTPEEYTKTTIWRREGEAEFVIEETRACLPRFSEALAERLTKPEVSTPLFADWYTIIDLGGSRDPTFITSGYYDFPRRKMRWQHEKKLIRPTTEEIAREAKALEARTFAQQPELRGLHFRIMDDDMGVVRRDLAQKYAFATIPPQKDDKDAALMDLQDALLREEIEFDPACPETLAQCQAAIWNKQHTEYERVDGFGHFDALDCVLYGHRNVVPNKGRVPHLYGVDLENTIVRHREPEVSPSTLSLRRAFGGN